MLTVDFDKQAAEGWLFSGSDIQVLSCYWYFKNPANQLMIVHPIIYRVLYIPGGLRDFWTSNSRLFQMRWKITTEPENHLVEKENIWTKSPFLGSNRWFSGGYQ